MASKTRQQLEEYIKTIPMVSGRILDIGGSQLPIKDRLTSVAEGTEFVILDLNEPHEEKKSPDIICDIQDEISDEFVKSIKRFDGAFCIEVSEYWWNPYRALSNINRLLKKGGNLWISFHFVYPVHNPLQQDFLRYTKNGAIKLLNESGFETLEVKPRKATANLYAYYAEEQMRPARDYLEHELIGCIIRAKKTKEV